MNSQDCKAFVLAESTRQVLLDMFSKDKSILISQNYYGARVSVQRCPGIS